MTALMRLKCIFFLTFKWTDSIYESRCDFLNRKFELGESIDEERNQESCREEESGSEEKEVVQRVSHEAQITTIWAPATEPFFIGRASGDGALFFALYFFTNF